MSQHSEYKHSANGLHLARIIALFAFVSLAYGLFVTPADATLPYSKDTGKKCYYCHANKIGEKSVLTEQGSYWISHNKSFEGMPEELVAGPPEPEKTKNTPAIAIILMPVFFIGIVTMIIVSIMKKPAIPVADGEKPSMEAKKNSDNE